MHAVMGKGAYLGKYWHFDQVCMNLVLTTSVLHMFQCWQQTKWQHSPTDLCTLFFELQVTECQVSRKTYYRTTYCRIKKFVEHMSCRIKILSNFYVFKWIFCRTLKCRQYVVFIKFGNIRKLYILRLLILQKDVVGTIVQISVSQTKENV
jgi:hypothetical protein